LAIVQISKITQRKGLQTNLPQLAGAEFGWSVDTRQLYIGNGTLEEGAPVIGNTEILTEFSDILALSTTYTYKGEAAGYTVQTGATPGSPVTQSLQSWFDQWASITDFGAVGDGVTDCTDAINRALYQLFCREVNPQIRRALFFPAGVYLISETIVIPPFATLYGEGVNNSIIQLTSSGDESTLNAYVARTGDSLQQTGTNIGNNGATVPQYVTVSNLGFASAESYSDIFLIDRAVNCCFQNVSFTGPLTTAELTVNTNDIAGIRFDSSVSLICSQIVFDSCVFSGTTYGLATEEQINGVVVQNSRLDTLYQGIVLGVSAPVSGGPTGVRMMHNIFDNIYVEGIKLGAISLNATGYNIFYDVGNYFNGITSPQTSIVSFNGDNNVSVGDMFARSDANATNYPRIQTNSKQVIATTNGATTQQGTYTRSSGTTFSLTDNASNQTIVTISNTLYKAWAVDYTIVRSDGVNTNVRTGRFLVAGVGTINWDDNFTENSSTGITLSATISGTDISWIYSATSTGFNGTLTYSITHLA
jgi:hypothetical protein